MTDEEERIRKMRTIVAWMSEMMDKYGVEKTDVAPTMMAVQAGAILKYTDEHGKEIASHFAAGVMSVLYTAVKGKMLKDWTQVEKENGSRDGS